MFTDEQRHFLTNFLTRSGYYSATCVYDYQRPLGELGPLIASTTGHPFADSANFAVAVVLFLFHPRVGDRVPASATSATADLLSAMRWHCNSERAMELGLDFALYPSGPNYPDSHSARCPWPSALNYFREWIADILQPILGQLIRLLQNSVSECEFRDCRTAVANADSLAALIAEYLLSGQIVERDSSNRLGLDRDVQLRRRMAEQRLAGWTGDTPLGEFLRRACAGGHYVVPRENVVIYGMAIDLLDPPVQRGNVLSCAHCSRQLSEARGLRYPSGECPQCREVRWQGAENKMVMSIWFAGTRVQGAAQRCYQCERFVFVDPTSGNVFNDEGCVRAATPGGPHAVRSRTTKVWVPVASNQNPPELGESPSEGTRETLALHAAWRAYQAQNGIDVQAAYRTFWRQLTSGVCLRDAVVEHIPDGLATSSGCEFVRLMVLSRHIQNSTFDLPAPPEFWTITLLGNAHVARDVIPRLGDAVDRALAESEAIEFDGAAYFGRSNNG